MRTWERSGQQRSRTPPLPDLSWREERSVSLSDLVEYPPESGQYRPYWEVDEHG